MAVVVVVVVVVARRVGGRVLKVPSDLVSEKIIYIYIYSIPNIKNKLAHLYFDYIPMGNTVAIFTL